VGGDVTVAATLAELGGTMLELGGPSSTILHQLLVETKTKYHQYFMQCLLNWVGLN
jgi:hypothetical protein